MPLAPRLTYRPIRRVHTSYSAQAEASGRCAWISIWSAKLYL